MLSEIVAAWDAFAAQETPRHSALFHFDENDRVLNDLVASITHATPSSRSRVNAVSARRQYAARSSTVSAGESSSRSPRPTTSADYLLKTLLVDFGVIPDHETARRCLGSTSREDLLQALDRFLSSLTRLLRKGNLRLLDDRIALRIEFGSPAPSEGPAYLAHRLAATGKSARVQVDDDALRETFVFSGGLPGVLNELCDRAAPMGAQLRAGRVDAEVVVDAAHALGIGTEHRSARWRDRALLTRRLIVMLVAGAIGAGWMFRRPLRRAITQWRGGDPSTSSTAR